MNKKYFQKSNFIKNISNNLIAFSFQTDETLYERGVHLNGKITQTDGGDDEERSEERLAEDFCMMKRRLKKGEKNEE